MLQVLFSEIPLPKSLYPGCSSFFFFTGPAPSDFYTLSLHDALPISPGRDGNSGSCRLSIVRCPLSVVCCQWSVGDRKSTRLNSSHRCSSYAVFCLKKKKSATGPTTPSTSDRFAPTVRGWVWRAPFTS